MKKSIISLLLVACLLPCFISFAAANEGYALHTRNFIPEVIYAKLKLMPSADIVLLDKNPSVGSVDYVSWVSYDYLSELSLKWDTSGVIVYNSYMDAYFIRVSYVPTVSNNGEYEYCSLGTSNGFVLGSRNPNSSTTIDNSTTIGTVNLITNKYISTVVNSASKTASSVTNGLTNILSWLEVLSDGIELMIRHQDFTNDILYWIADEFYDMMHLIGEINLTIAEADIEQLKSLNRIDSVIRGISSNQVSLISALNTHLSSVSSQLTGIDTKLSSVIRNGQIQVNTSPIEARLDKLISMYSKVNSVVLDTASVNGGQITGAVGGELQDAVFWGDTAKSNDEFLTSDGLRYRLGPNVGNTTLTTLDDSIVLRSVPVSASFDGDSVVSAGIWQKGSSRILSDTYNATTGVYIQRVGIIDLGSLPYVYLPYPFNSNFSLYNTQTEFLSMRQDIDGGDLLCSGLTSFAGYISSDDNPNKSISSNHNGYLYIRYDEAANSTELLDYVSGMQLLYPLAVPIIQQFDPSTIAIPEGDSAIAADYLRITGKYETYESFTQTADIISGIGRTEALLSSINTDVQNIKSYTSSIKTTTSTISTNVGKVNTALTSVIKDGKFKVDNSDIVTALGKLDKLAELPTIKTAVDGVNTTISSVISQGKLKVDNSAVVAAIEGIRAGSAADLSPVISRLDTLINKTSDTVVNVVNNNTYITNVFQLDDDTSVVDTTKDGVGKVSGLFKWLWNNTFKGAFSHADITKLDGLL